MKSVRTDKAPMAIGPYSQAIAAGNLVFCSGQIALEPSTGVIVGGGIKEQTARVFKNLEEVLRASGTGFDSVASVSVYLRSMNDFKEMNEVYAETFGKHKPARVTVAVSGLPKDALIEISCVAVTAK